MNSFKGFPGKRKGLKRVIMQAERRFPAVAPYAVTQPVLRRVLSFLSRYGSLGGFVLVVTLASVIGPGFANLSNLRALLFQLPMLAIVSAGLTLVISAGDLDISTGATVSLAGVLAAKLFSVGIEVPVVIVACLGSGLFVGVLNGALVGLFGINSLITTFGTSVMIQGVIYALCGGTTIVLTGAAAKVPFLFLGQGTLLGGVPVPGFVTFLLFLGLIIYFDFTRPGWHLRDVGDNRLAARLFAVHDRRVIVGAFAVCSVCSTLAGLVLAARLGGGSPIGGDNYTLNAIAAIYVGAAFFGRGIPNPIGTLLGAAAFVILENCLSLAGIEFQIQSLLRGVVIILAVTIGSISRRARFSR